MAERLPIMNCRDFLKLMSTFAATSAVATACAPESIPGPNPSPTQGVIPVDPTGVPPEPTLPPVPLGIIALNRMAFGPRPGDIEVFNALGTTDEERLRAYASQQLSPESIEDADFESRFTAAEFETLNKTQDELYLDHIVNNQYELER